MMHGESNFGKKGNLTGVFVYTSWLQRPLNTLSKSILLSGWGVDRIQIHSCRGTWSCGIGWIIFDGACWNYGGKTFIQAKSQRIS